MSEQIDQIQTARGELQITEFFGGERDGPMLQLTQGLGGSPDAPGFIQLTLTDAAELVPKIVAWIRDESRRRAEILRAQIAADKRLEKTIFSEAAECERFIAEFEVPKMAVALLASIKPCVAPKPITE